MNHFNDSAPLSKKGILAGFLMLFSEWLFVVGFFTLILDHQLWALGLMLVGGLSTWRCLCFACTKAAYR